MKLYVAKFAPNPRRVLIYLREKGLDIETVWVDLVKGENRAEPFLGKNPLGLLPVLELDDGSFLTESVAIFEYLEELHPEPVLIGTTPIERARTREASRIAEFGLLLGAAQIFQHTQPYFADRINQSEAIAEDGRIRFTYFCKRINGMLAERKWLAGDRFTVADITAVCAVDFANFSKCGVPEKYVHVHRWLDDVRGHDSCRIGS